MKKWKVFYWVFFCLFFITWGYFDIYIKSESVYWLVGKWLWIFLIFVGGILMAVLKRQVSKVWVIYRICFAIFFLSFWGYRDLEKYKKYACEAKFGPEFNQRRRKLSTPEIPADWIKESYTDDWKAKDTIGHVSKHVQINSDCAIEFEEDEYTFKTIHGIPRDVTIKTYYAKGKGQDSIFYHWVGGIDTNRYITRQQADSIFAAEKIRKDY